MAIKIKNKKISGATALLTAVFLAVAAGLLYYPVIDYPFIDYDDNAYISDNPMVRQGLDGASVLWAFRAGVQGTWQPMVWLSYMAGCSIYGLDAGWHHLTNVLFHMANVLLLFLLVRRATGAFFESVVVALLFAVHPLHVESVAWIAERKDVLSAFFCFLTLIAWVRFAESPGIRAYLPVVFFLALGLMSKPMLVTLPAVLLLLDVWPLRRLQPVKPEKQAAAGHRMKSFILLNGHLILEKLPLFGLVALSSAVTVAVQEKAGAIGSDAFFPPGVRIGNAIISYVLYLFKFFWPFNLSVFYPHPGRVSLAGVIPSALVLIVLSAAALGAVKRRPWCFTGWSWFLGTLVPVIGIVQVGGHAMADRFTYIPYIGLYLIAAFELGRIRPRLRYGAVWVYGATVVAVVCLVLTTFTQIRYWADTQTLFEHALDVDPDNHVAHNILAKIKKNKGEIREAIRHYTASIRIRPNYLSAFVNLAQLHEKTGAADKARELYRTALAVDPRFTDALVGLGVSLAAEGRLDAASAKFRRALEIDGRCVEARFNLARVLRLQKKLDKAVDLLAVIVRQAPGFIPALFETGDILLRNGRLAEAEVWFEKVLTVDPGHDAAQQALKQVRRLMPVYDTAKTGIQKALAADPDNASLYFQLGELYRAVGNSDAALSAYETAHGLDGSSAATLARIVELLSSRGAYRQAAKYLEKHIALQPEREKLYYNMACLQARQERPEAALHWLRRAVQKGYSDTRKMMTDPDLSNIRALPEFSEIIPKTKNGAG